MKQDLKLGLILVIVLALAIVPRFLPHFDLPVAQRKSAEMNEAPAETAQESVTPKSTPTSEPATGPPVLKPTVEPQLPEVADPPEPVNVLSTVFPDGYKDEVEPKPKKETPDAKPEIEPSTDTFLVESSEATLPDLEVEPFSMDSDLSLPGFAALDGKDKDLGTTDEPIADETYVPVSLEKGSETVLSSAAEQTDQDSQSKQMENAPKELELKAPTNYARKPPVHPFFQRYIDRREYYVREGDTLESIAYRLYQDKELADTLFRLNRAKLAFPGDLKPGMVLKLP